jgi:hypothetical protein
MSYIDISSPKLRMKNIDPTKSPAALSSFCNIIEKKTKLENFDFNRDEPLLSLIFEIFDLMFSNWVSFQA